MKSFIFLFFIFMSFSLLSQTQAKTESALITEGIQNYEVCLKHENRGVVESAIVNVLKFKHKYPQADMKTIEALLEELCNNQDDTKISCKARLALQILQSPELLNMIEKEYFTESDQFLDILLMGASMKPTAVNDIRQK